MRRVLLCGSIALLALACGPGVDKKLPANNGGANNGDTNGATHGTNNGSTNNGSTNNGSTNNGATNNGATNNLDGPCVVVQPNSIAFGTVEVGSSTTDGFVIENCSADVALEIDAASEDGPFALLLPQVDVLQPGASLNVPVVYQPLEAGEHAGTVSVMTSAGRLDVEVSGTASSADVTCPEAVARVRVVGGTFASTASGTTGQIVEFSAADSFGRAGEIANYEWTIVARPQGSTAVLSPSAHVSNPSLMLDVAGTFTAELTVFDDNGEASCTKSRATVTAAPDDDYEVQLKLTWNTDLTDLDLHYLHPSGAWNNEPWDCYWRNGQPEWGAPGPADDPNMDIDDISGFGPENISHSGLEDAIYQVGVFMYAGDAGTGPPTTPTTRIYIDGALIHEDVGGPMTQGLFRHAATIDGGSKSVTATGRLTVGFP